MDDTIRLALEITGAQSAEELKTSLSALNDQAGNAAAAFARGDLSSEEYDQSLKQISVTAGIVRDALRAVEAAEAEEMRQAHEAIQAHQEHAETVSRATSLLDKFAAEEAEAAEALGREQNALFAAEGAMDEFAAAGNRAAAVNNRVARSAGDATAKTLLFHQGITALSFAIQDATSAGGDIWQKLGSVTNNVPQILGLFGVGGPIAAGALAILSISVAIGKNWDSIVGLFETRNPFPRAADDVGRMRRELENSKDQLEKMEKLGSGNADQIERYNALRERTVRLEERISREQEQQQRLQKVRQCAD